MVVAHRIGDLLLGPETVLAGGGSFTYHLHLGFLVYGHVSFLQPIFVSFLVLSEPVKGFWILFRKCNPRKTKKSLNRKPFNKRGQYPKSNTFSGDVLLTV